MTAGMDSMSANEITNALGKMLNTKLPQTLVFDHPTIASVTSFISVTCVDGGVVDSG